MNCDGYLSYMLFNQKQWSVSVWRWVDLIWESQEIFQYLYSLDDGDESGQRTSPRRYTMWMNALEINTLNYNGKGFVITFWK